SARLLRFYAAGHEYAELHAAGKSDTSEAVAALHEMLENAPEDFIEHIHGDAVELALLPVTPDYCTADGEAAYDLDDIARRAGVCNAEARRVAAAIGIDPLPASDVHRRN